MATTKPTAKRLWALSSNICAYPGCETKLSKREWPEVMGRECHIRAQNPGGPRWDPGYADVDGFDNIILMCPTCHTVIDDLEPELWPVERLEELKAEHEERGEDGKKNQWWFDPAVDPDVDARLSWLATAIIERVLDRQYMPTSTPPSGGRIDTPPRVREVNDIVLLTNPNDFAITVIEVKGRTGRRAIMAMEDKNVSMPPGHEMEIARMARALGDTERPVLAVVWQSAGGGPQETDYPLGG